MSFLRPPIFFLGSRAHCFLFYFTQIASFYFNGVLLFFCRLSLFQKKPKASLPFYFYFSLTFHWVCAHAFFLESFCCWNRELFFPIFLPVYHIVFFSRLVANLARFQNSFPFLSRNMSLFFARNIYLLFYQCSFIPFLIRFFSPKISSSSSSEVWTSKVALSGCLAELALLIVLVALIGMSEISGMGILSSFAVVVSPILFATAAVPPCSRKASFRLEAPPARSSLKVCWLKSKFAYFFSLCIFMCVSLFFWAVGVLSLLGKSMQTFQKQIGGIFWKKKLVFKQHHLCVGILVLSVPFASMNFKTSDSTSYSKQVRINLPNSQQ